MELPIIKVKKDDGYELVINLSNLMCINKKYDSSNYYLVFREGWNLEISWKEFDRIDKAIQHITI